MGAAEEQKKRTLEALERRFIVAKAEIQQQEDKSNKRQLLEKSISAPKSDHKTFDSAKPSSSSSSLFRKDHSTSQDTEANSPVYAQLSHKVDDNLLVPNPKISSRKGSMVDKILHELLENGDSAQKYMQGSRSMKVDNWILLDNYVPVCRLAAGNKPLPNHSKRSKKHMSMKQHKKIGSLELPCELQKFNSFLPIHDMWKSYITQLIKTVGRNQLAQCLLSADLHGAIIQVAQCKITSFTGISGIMIRETAETFGIITVDDKFRVVPKKNKEVTAEINCNDLLTRRTGRAGRTGEAITFYTDDDFPYLRNIANAITASGNEVPAWIKTMPKLKWKKHRPKRDSISTGPDV